MTPDDLLTFLAARGGREYRVTALLRAGRGKKATVRELGEYRVTMRGSAVLACGPSGQPRQLSQAEFCAVFGTYTFGAPKATGVLTDLGPLFGADIVGDVNGAEAT